VDLNPAILGEGCRFVQLHSGLAVGVVRSPVFTVYGFDRGHVVAPGRRLEHVPVLVWCGTGAPSVIRTGTRSHAACKLSPEGTKENSPGFQPGDSRRAQIESRRDDRIRIRSQMHLGSHSIPWRLGNVNNFSLRVL